jgi:hypothetical protein
MAYLAVVSVSITMHEKAQPYLYSQIALLERYALLTSFLTAYFGLYFTDGRVRDQSSRVFFSLCIFAVNILYMV